jgi:hypothetical protein
VCEDAVALLRGIRTPVGVVAVAGRARTGKSFILNQLLGRAAGFRLAHSHRCALLATGMWGVWLFVKQGVVFGAGVVMKG